jgi:hypothetical protein
MSLRPVFVLGLLVAMSSVTGCSSGFGFGKMKPFAKSEQWEPDVEQPKTDWRSDAGKLGRGNRRAEKEDPLDKILWSDQARDINRNMGFN